MPSNILPEDNIPANSELVETPNLGLLQIPRANNEALAAINASLRILDALVLKNNGDIASGEHTFEKIITPELEATLATISNLIATTGSVTNLTIINSTVTNETVETLNATNLFAEDATIEDLDITGVLTALQATITTLTAVTSNVTTLNVSGLATLVQTAITTLTATVATLQTLNVTGHTILDTVSAASGEFEYLTIGNLPFGQTQNTVGEIIPAYGIGGNDSHSVGLAYTPHIIDYTLHIKDTVETKITGWIDFRNNTKGYTVLEVGDLITTQEVGLGFPQHNALEFYNITYDIMTKVLKFKGFNSINYSSNADFDLIFKAIKYPN